MRDRYIAILLIGFVVGFLAGWMTNVPGPQEPPDCAFARDTGFPSWRAPRLNDQGEPLNDIERIMARLQEVCFT